MGDGRASLLAGPPPAADAPQDGADTQPTQPFVPPAPTDTSGNFDFSTLVQTPTSSKCPVPGCLNRFHKKASLTAHLRNFHKGTVLDSATESQLQLARCPKCMGYYCSAGVNTHAAGCKRNAPSARLPLATQLISNHPQQSLVPAPPPHLKWVAGPPNADPLWILDPLIRSLTDLSFAGGLAEFYASGVAGSYRWDRWKEHLLCEHRHRGPSRAPVDIEAPMSSDDAVSHLKGDSANPLACALCNRPDSPFQASSLLALVDHMNHSHALALDQHTPIDDVKRCACSYLFVDTAVGRDAHMQSCRHMADARSLDYNPSLLPASHATIKILEIMTRMTSVETPNGHFRRFAVGDAGLILDAVECGSSYGLHTQCCFYLSHAAPCDITVVDSAHAVEREHGEHSIALKGRLAPAATTLSSLLEPKLFTLLNAPADTEVFVCAAKDDGPLAVFNISVSPPRIQLIMDSSAAADTAVRLILKTGEHFQRLFGPNRAEVTVGTLMDLGPTRDQPFSVVPKPAPCLVGRITEWADSFCQKWRAAFPPPRGDNSDAPPNPPQPPPI